MLWRIQALLLEPGALKRLLGAKSPMGVRIAAYNLIALLSRRCAACLLTHHRRRMCSLRFPGSAKDAFFFGLCAAQPTRLRLSEAFVQYSQHVEWAVEALA